VPNTMEKSPLEPQPNHSLLSLILEAQISGSHHTHATHLPAGYTRPMIHPNHPHTKQMVKPLTSLMVQDQLLDHYALITLDSVMSQLLMPLSLKPPP